MANRIGNAEPKIVVTADVGYRRGNVVNLKEVVDETLKISGKSVEKVIILKRSEKDPSLTLGRDILWQEAIEKGKGINAKVEKMRADEPAFILYTSGTMAKPKGTVQHHGSYQVYIYAMGKWVYDMREKMSGGPLQTSDG